MVDQFDCQSYDYISNTANDDLLNVPDGLDVEIFSMSALSRAWREAYLDFELEHVTPWFRNSCSNISWSHIQYSRGLPYYHLTVDDSADYKMASHLSSLLDSSDHSMTLDTLISLLAQNKDISDQILLRLEMNLFNVKFRNLKLSTSQDGACLKS